MKKLCLLLMLFLVGAVVQAQAQSCPPDLVCISPQAARQALEDSDVRKAQASEIMTLREAVVKQKEVTVDVKIELAKAIGEKTGAQNEVIRVTAILDFMMKNGRNKCGGITLFCIQK